MSSTYSTNLAIELMATGDQDSTWGDTTNNNLGTLLEQAISGYVTQAITNGADTVITIPDGVSGVARNMYIELTGTLTAARNLIVPVNKKLYFIYNNTVGGFPVTVKVAGQTGVVVPNGYKYLLVSNGTDVVQAITNTGGSGGGGGTYFNQVAVATQGQTVFSLTTPYLIGSNNLSVYVNGSKQIAVTNYTETSTTSITFLTGLNVGDLVQFTIGATTALSTNASAVLYNEGGTGAVNRNVEQKLQEQVSILDFGAVADGDGYGSGTNNSAAIQAAIDYIVGNVGYGVKNKLWIPAGIYRCDTGLTLDLSVCGIESNGATLDFTNLVPAAGGAYAAGVATNWIGPIQGAALTVTAGGDGYAGGAYYEFTNSVRGLRIKGKEGASEGGTPPSAPNDTIGVYFYGPVGETAVNGMFESCVITQFYTGVAFGQNEFGVMFQQCQIGFTSSCVAMPSANNAGEKNVFSSCILFNSENGFVLENSNADTFIENTSIDGMSAIFLYVTCGTVSLNGCHFEGDMSAANLIWNDGSGGGSYATITMNGCVIVSKTDRNTPLFIFSGNTSCSIHGGLVNDSNGSTVTLFGGNTGSSTASVTIVGGYWASSASLFGFSVPANAYTSVVGLLGLGINGNLTTNQVIATSKNIQGSTIFANSGIFDNNVTTLNTTTLNVAVPFAIPNSAIGLLIIRDATLGGQALYMCEVSSAVVAVQTSVSGITVNYSGGGALQLTVTSGTAARSIRWAFIRTN